MRHARSAALSRIKKLLKKERLMQATGSGEISMVMLEEMSQHDQGWVGRVFQSLLMAFSQPASSYAAAEYLEQAAAQLIAWSTEIRHAASKSNTIPTAGSEVLVRLPNHFPSFEAIVEGEDRVYVPLLDKTFPISDILILPRPAPSVRHRKSDSDAETSGMRQSLEQHIHRFHDLRFSTKS